MHDGCICIFTISEYIKMNLLEQFIEWISQQLSNFLFEPVIIDKRLLDIFEGFVSKLNVNKSNIAMLQDTLDILRKVPNNDLLSAVFRDNLEKCLHILIMILMSNEDRISKLTEENKKLKKTRIVTQFELRGIMSIPFELIR